MCCFWPCMSMSSLAYVLSLLLPSKRGLFTGQQRHCGRQSSACSGAQSQRLLQELAEQNTQSTGAKPCDCPTQLWFKAALDSPFNAKGAAGKVIKQHQQSQEASKGGWAQMKDLMMGSNHLVAYLRLGCNVLAHAELEGIEAPAGEAERSPEDIRLMDLCPLGDCTDLVTTLASALAHGGASSQQPASAVKPEVLQHRLRQQSPRACSAAREARTLQPMLQSYPPGLRAQAMPRCAGSRIRQRFRPWVRVHVLRLSRPSLAHMARMV